MSSKNSVAPKNGQSSFIRQELLAADQSDYLSLRNSTVLVEPLGKGRDRNSGIQISAPRPELTNQWWTTFASIPTSQNPLSLDNEGIIDDIRQTGSIHFLGGALGTLGNVKVERDIVVAQNQSIVIPILTQGADNVAWDFNSDGIPDEFLISELQLITDAIMDTAKNVALSINSDRLINSKNMDQFRVRSNDAYTLTLPEDDILDYRDNNPDAPEEWFNYPYTQGVQSGYWVEIRDLPLGDNTIHFTGTINYRDIDVRDYDNSGGIGDTPLESLLLFVRDNYPTARFNVTYNVDVLSRPDFNAQLHMLG